MPCPPCVRNSLVLFLESPDGQLVTLGSVGILQLLTLHYALDGKFSLQLVRFSNQTLLLIPFIHFPAEGCRVSDFHCTK